MSALLEVKDLAVCFGGEVEALRGVSFSLDRGQSLAVVGETGSGKSTLALGLAGLIQPPEATGSVALDGTELLGAPAEVVRALRWATVAVGLQGSPFNPVVTVGSQIAEPLVVHRGLGRAAAAARAAELAGEVLLDPELLERFAHELSGGERRRATLAMVLALDPALVVLDEPTAGLDPSTRAELVDHLQALAQTRGFALVVISHDLADAARLAARSLVLYAGAVVEAGESDLVMAQAAHPYTWALVNAYPVMTTTKDLRPIRGRPPDPRAVPAGCAFHPRCTQAEAICAEQRPALVASRGREVACHFGGLKTLLAATGITKSFRRGRREVRALDDVSLRVAEGESLGIIGPSGSGKSTLARILAGHLAPDAGQVVLEGTALPTSWRGAARARRRRIQLVMQDPADALSARMTVAELVGEPLDVGVGGGVGVGVGDDDHASPAEAVAQALDSVGLPSSGSFLAARSHELSGGQLQRICLARALVAGPKLLVADEPTSMLDASEQARMLVVLRERQVEMGLGLILISHDMAVIRKVTDRIVVLDRGRVVEEGPSEEVSTAPASATGRALIAAAPALPRRGRSPSASRRDSGTEKQLPTPAQQGST